MHQANHSSTSLSIKGFQQKGAYNQHNHKLWNFVIDSCFGLTVDYWKPAIYINHHFLSFHPTCNAQKLEATCSCAPKLDNEELHINRQSGSLETFQDGGDELMSWYDVWFFCCCTAPCLQRTKAKHKLKTWKWKWSCSQRNFQPNSNDMFW